VVLHLEAAAFGSTRLAQQLEAGILLHESIAM